MPSPAPVGQSCCNFGLDLAGLEVTEEEPDMLPATVEYSWGSWGEPAGGECHVRGELRGIRRGISRFLIVEVPWGRKKLIFPGLWEPFLFFEAV